MAAPLAAFIGLLDIPFNIITDAGSTEIGISINPGIENGVTVPNAAPGIVMDFTSQTDVWVSWYLYLPGNPTLDQPIFTIKDTAGNTVVELRVGTVTGNNALIRFYRRVAGVMTLTTTTVTNDLYVSTGIRFDARINLTAGTFSLYRNLGADVIAYTGSLNDGGAITDLRSAAFRSARGANVCYASTMWADTLDTRGGFWDEMTTLAAGFHAEQVSGVEADIDEVGNISFTDKVILDAVGERATFTQTGQNTTYSAGYDVQCLVVGAYALKVTGGRLTAMVRSGTTDEEGALRDLNLTGAGVGGLFVNNPDGAVPWTYATVGAAQIGFRAKVA